MIFAVVGVIFSGGLKMRDEHGMLRGYPFFVLTLSLIHI